MNTQQVFINDLAGTQIDLQLSVRLVRVWTVPKFKLLSQTESVDCLMVDIKGGRIQGIVSHKVIHKFSDFLIEGSIIEISKFILVDNKKGERKVTQHDYKLTFIEKTEVRFAPELDNKMPLHSFDLVPIGKVLEKTTDYSYLLDIIGKVSTFTELIPDASGKRSQDRLKITVIDESNNSIQITAWGQEAMYADSYFRQNEEKEVVLIGQFLKFIRNEFGVSANTNYNSGKLYLDAQLPETSDFRTRLHSNKVPNSRGKRMTKISAQGVFNTVDNFCSGATMTTVPELLSCYTKGDYVFIATIVNLVGGDDWSYIACKTCNKKVSTDIPCISTKGKEILLGSWWCPKCESCVDVVVPRFRLQVDVRSDNASIVITLFEKELRTMISRTASDLRAQYGYGGEVPAVLVDLISMTCLFRISMTDFDIRTRNYTVSRVTSDLNMLKKYKEIILVDGENVNLPEQVSSAQKQSTADQPSQLENTNISLDDENIRTDEDAAITSEMTSTITSTIITPHEIIGLEMDELNEDKETIASPHSPCPPSQQCCTATQKKNADIPICASSKDIPNLTSHIVSVDETIASGTYAMHETKYYDDNITDLTVQLENEDNTNSNESGINHKPINFTNNKSSSKKTRTSNMASSNISDLHDNKKTKFDESKVVKRRGATKQGRQHKKKTT